MKDKVPVTVLTGFLGAGKTTLLNSVLKEHPESRWLVIINEFGAVGVDHDLVVQSEPDTEPEPRFVELSNGCLCCTIRGDLTKTLTDAVWRFSRGGSRWFDRVVIETTGLADPAPIVQTLTTQAAVARNYSLSHIISVLDIPNAASTLDNATEAVKQIAVADTVVLTKGDLASPEQIQQTKQRVQRINPAAQLVDNVHAKCFSPHALFVAARFQPGDSSAEVADWLSHEVFETSHDHDHDHDHHHGHHRHDVNRHDENIR
ncbi:MAG: GTP-binding protein, partial [Pseudomonadota bacterium]